MNKLIVEAKSVAAFVNYLQALPHETRANITATENGREWATVTISPMTDTRRSVFPNFLGTTATGDSRKRGESGVHFNQSEARHNLGVVIERARKMR